MQQKKGNGMTCKQCRNFEKCMKEAGSLEQVFDPDYDGEHSCATNNFIAKTNADRIRDMRSVELARLLVDAVADGCPPNKDWDCAKDDYGWDGCEACWERWLQQPAEE